MPDNTRGPTSNNEENESIAAQLVSSADKIKNVEENLKNQLFKHFVKSSKYYLKNYPTRPELVYGLHAIYQLIIKDPKVNFFLGDDENNKENENKLAIKKINLLASQLREENEKKINNELLAFSSISFMRFISNKIATAITAVQLDTPGGNYLQLKKQYQPIQNQIQILSTIKNFSKLKLRTKAIYESNNWNSYSKLIKKTYVKLQNNGDILGLNEELEIAESITIGSRILGALLIKIYNLPKGESYGNAILKLDLESDTSEELMAMPQVFHRSQKIKRTTASVTATSAFVIGNIPGQYINKNKNEFYFGFVEIKNRLIVDIKELPLRELESFVRKNKNSKVFKLKNEKPGVLLSCASCHPEYDAIYPGLINLHNHTKQNNLSVWGLAQGQFGNRFEWREWDYYKKSVSQNMNPWIQFGKPIECAAFRWSEMQALVTGTVYLQGPSSCVSQWGIHRVEDKSAYISNKLAVQAPTDIVVPNDMVFVWRTLKPLIESGKNYEQALTQVIHEYCPSLIPLVNEFNINEPAGLEILTDQNKLESSCGQDATKPLPAKFIRYIYWVHDGIAGKKKYLKDKMSAAVIAHLAEGSRTDIYNLKEYEIIKLLGLNLPRMNFVHGVGIEAKNFNELANNKMGLIWSPFSNLLLYGETLDILAAHQAGVTIALGSDWLPTGSRGVLEEVKVAANYIDRTEGLKEIFTDEYLFKMMTENPATMINHFEISATEAAIGKLEKGAMGSLIAASFIDLNPYTNLVRKVSEKQINLVLVDGVAVYGNTDYLNQNQEKYEVLSDLDTVIFDNEKISYTETQNLSTAENNLGGRLLGAAKFANLLTIFPVPACRFETKKGFVHQSTFHNEVELELFAKSTGLNLDRFLDIQKLLATSLLNLSANKTTSGLDKKHAVKYFPPLYSCNDLQHVKRITNYVKPSGQDELAENIKNRSEIRRALTGKSPASLAEKYK